MGQIVVPGSPPSIILSAVDRLVAANSDGGVSPLASHIILFGENAGQNLGDLDNVIAMGFNTLSGGNADVLNSGMIVIGSLSLAALTNATPSPTEDGPSTVIGFNNFPLLANRFGSNSALGESIYSLLPAAGGEVARSVLIGTDVGGNQRVLNANGPAAVASVLIGHNAAKGTAFATLGGGVSIQGSVLIGQGVCENAGVDSAAPGCSINTSVAIGRLAAQQWGSGAAGNQISGSVAIGEQCASTQRSGNDNTFIGAGITTTLNLLTNNVVIGDNIAANFTAPGLNVVVGSNAQVGVGIGQRNLVMGYRAGGGLTGATSDKLLFETNDGANTRTWLYGLAALNTSGGIVVGQSVVGTRDLPGFNILKVLNGTTTGVAPVGGGFLYATGGELHWVSSTNVDYTMTPSANRGTFTVATLPAANLLASQRAFVTDALAPAFGAAVAGGGAVFVPVFYDGAAWIVG